MSPYTKRLIVAFLTVCAGLGAILLFQYFTGYFTPPQESQLPTPLPTPPTQSQELSEPENSQ